MSAFLLSEVRVMFCFFFADSVAGKGDVNIMCGICVARWLVIEVVWMPC